MCSLRLAALLNIALLGAVNSESEVCVGKALLQMKAKNSSQRDRGSYDPNRIFKRMPGCSMARTPPSLAQRKASSYCNPDGSSYESSFSSDTATGFATISSNNCPAHKFENNIPAPFTDNCALVMDWTYTIPLTPVFRDEAGNADSSATAAQSATDGRNYKARWVEGRIGIALSNVMVAYPGTGKDYDDGDAMVSEGSTFDYCGGHSSPTNNAGDGGFYHYHGQPYCLDRNSGDDDDVAEDYLHSPLVAWMLDGFPLYGHFGDSGELPTDLDECNGHSGDSGANGGYHYHTTGYKGKYTTTMGPNAGDSTYWPYATDSPKFAGDDYYTKPYTIGCFRGCVPDEVDWGDYQMEDYATCVANSAPAPDYQMTLASAGYEVQTDFEIDDSAWTSAAGATCSDTYYVTTSTTTAASTTTSSTTTTTSSTTTTTSSTTTTSTTSTTGKCEEDYCSAKGSKKGWDTVCNWNKCGGCSECVTTASSTTTTSTTTTTTSTTTTTTSSTTTTSTTSTTGKCWTNYCSGKADTKGWDTVCNWNYCGGCSECR